MALLSSRYSNDHFSVITDPTKREMGATEITQIDSCKHTLNDKLVHTNVSNKTEYYLIILQSCKQSDQTKISLNFFS